MSTTAVNPVCAKCGTEIIVDDGGLVMIKKRFYHNTCAPDYRAAPAPSSPSPDSLEQLIERLTSLKYPQAVMDAAAELSRMREELDEAQSASLFDKACLQGEIRLTQAAVTRALAAEADNKVLLNALKAARAPIAQLIADEYNVETWGLKMRLELIDAALGGQHGQ